MFADVLPTAQKYPAGHAAHGTPHMHRLPADSSEDAHNAPVMLAAVVPGPQSLPAGQAATNTKNTQTKNKTHR